MAKEPHPGPGHSSLPQGAFVDVVRNEAEDNRNMYKWHDFPYNWGCGETFNFHPIWLFLPIICNTAKLQVEDSARFSVL